MNRNFEPESLYYKIIVNTINKRWIYYKDAENERKLLKEKYLEQENEIRKQNLEKQVKEYKEKSRKAYKEKFIEPFSGMVILRQLIKNKRY